MSTKIKSVCIIIIKRYNPIRSVAANYVKSERGWCDCFYL